MANATHSPERDHYWYRRGRKDGLSGSALMDFSAAPDHWTDEDIASAKAAYGRGLDSADADELEYRRLIEEVHESDALAASPDTNDPTRAYELLAQARSELTKFVDRISVAEVKRGR